MSWRVKLYEADDSGEFVDIIKTSLSELLSFPHLEYTDGKLAELIIACEKIARGTASNVSDAHIRRYADKIQLALATEKFIHENCQPFLQQAGDRVLYRGSESLTSSPYTAYVINVRSDRWPKDSSESLHDALNNAISMYDLTANRSNSLFCSGDATYAAEYGDVYRVYPIGKFNYTWDRETADQTDRFDRFKARNHLWHKFHAFADRNDGPAFRDKMNKYKQYVHSRGVIPDPDDEFDFYNASPREIFFNGMTGMFGLDAESYADDIVSELYKEFERQVIASYLYDNREFVGDDGTLVEAIDSGHEVMIHCKRAVMVRR